MKLEILEQTFEIDVFNVDMLIEKINHLLKDSNQIVEYMKINDIEIYDQFESYLQNHFYEIKSLKIVSVTVETMMKNLSNSILQYINRAIPEIEVLIKEFYKEPSKNTWDQFLLMLEGITWIDQAVSNLGEFMEESQNGRVINEIQMKIKSELPNLLDAVKKRDTILIADITQYEILDNLNMVKNEIENLIND